MSGGPPVIGGGGPPGGGGSGGSSSGSSSSSSSSSSSAPAAPPVDPVVAQRESIFRSIYTQLWGEPPTQAYLKQAANSGMNSEEFKMNEMAKPAFLRTKTFKDEFSKWADLLKGLGVG